MTDCRRIHDAKVLLLRKAREVSVSGAATSLVLACLSACHGGPPAPPVAGNGTEQIVTGAERLGWNQPAPSFRELTAYRHWVYVDGIRFVLPARCSYLQSANGHLCVAPLPRMGAGRHVLELTTTLSGGSDVLESARSEPLVVIVVGAPQTGFGNAADVRAPLEPVSRAPLAEARYGYELVATALRLPVALAPMPDGNLFIGERLGTVKIARPDYPAPGVALDVSELRDVAGSEIALHGIAVHPAFRQNAFVYVMYTEATAGEESVTRIARFRHVAGRLGERVVLLDQLPARRVDPGGAIGFGADGRLYVATDDGGLATGRSDPAVLAGKVLRLNEDGSAGSDNPHASPVIFAGLHCPTALGWYDGGAGVSVVDEASPEPPGAPWRQYLVSVHAFADVSSAGAYRGTMLPQLTGKLVIAQKGSLGYTDPARPETGVSQLLLTPDLGRIQVVGTDREGSLYVGTGNTDAREEVGRDVLVRLAPAHPGVSTPTPSPLLRR